MNNGVLNVAELKVSNRRRVLECLRYRPLSRAELSREIGLTKSSITTLTNEMISEGIIYELGAAPKSNKAGRTATLLDINKEYGFILGITLHRKRISVSAIDIKGNLFFEFYCESRAFFSAETALEYICNEADKQIKEKGLNKEKLLYIGVASPGPLDIKKGLILQPPNFPLFSNFPIVKALKKRYNRPVTLENNAVALALSEAHKLMGISGRSLFIVIADGIGGAILHNGEVYRGSHGVAGELGHISIDFNGEECECGNRGCLEKYATLSALKKRFGFEDYGEVVEGAIINDYECERILNYLVQTLGSALATAVNIFDLDKIILYGEYSYKSELLTKRLEKYLSGHAIICRSHKVEVVSSVQSAEHNALAAAVPALNLFFEEVICKLP